MTGFENRNEDNKQQWDSRLQKDNNSGRVLTGVFILIIGIAAFMKASFLDLPDWVFSWKMLLIAIGFFIGLRHNFKDITWLILVLIGGVFLINDVYPELAFRRYMWPLALIILGLFIILKPRQRRRMFEKRRRGNRDDFNCFGGAAVDSNEEFIDSTNIFGGTKKNIISKNFKGGDLVNIFGGTELDMTQADFTGVAMIDVTNIFGGTKLIIPSNWEVRSEAVTILGGIDDKRKMTVMTEKPEKTLLLKGTVLFGGIEIKSY